MKKKHYKNKYKAIFVLFLMFLVSIINNNEILNKHLLNKEDICLEEQFPNFSEAFNKSINFLQKCLAGILINNQTINKTNNPIVSTVVPIFNSQKTISRAIKSIQNQNILNQEIILVNDFSFDNTLSIIEKIQKNDSRIKIIKNKKNMGTLYSRSIGVLSAKGKYIFHLDSDDMFLDEDIFSTMINIADKGNFDIIAFKSITSRGRNILTNRIKPSRLVNHNKNQVLFQPELGLYPLRPGKKLGKYKIKDNYLWNKCIRASIYQKALNKIGKNRYSRYMMYEEDRIVIFVLFNLARSLKFILKFGVLKIQTRGSTTKRIFPAIRVFLCILYFVDIAIDFVDDSFQSKKRLVYLITTLLKVYKLKNIKKLDKLNQELIISCLNRVLKDKYVSNADKEVIRISASSLQFFKTKNI